VLRHLFAIRRRYHFFARASFKISASSWTSAYIFFKRLFSSSSSLSRPIKLAFMPPNLLRYL
jgi:hypothetical protein